MQKLILLFFLIVPCIVHATGMCVHTGSYVVQLSTSRDGVSFETGNDGAWSVTFDYPTSSLNTNIVRGFSSCNEVSGIVNTADSNVSAVAGEVSGENCWCVMKMPLISDWVNAGAYASTPASSDEYLTLQSMFGNIIP